MNIEEIQKICENLPGVTTDIKWEDHLCFNIGGKMFLVTSPDKVPVSASFKVPDSDFPVLVEEERFEPAQYLARYKWVYVEDISLISIQEWQKYILDSYQLISEKLPKKMRKEMGLE